MNRRPPARPVAAAFAALLLSCAPASAKPPTLTGLFPAGAAQGQTVAVAASGSFDHWPVTGWADGRGVEVKAAAEKGKLSIVVAADAETGVRWVRLADEEGATSLRPFVVGSLPEVTEAEPNDDPKGPQRVDGPGATVNGRLAKPGDVDGFAVALGRGRVLVADLEANRHLGSPMDAVLQVVTPGGFVLEQNDDAVGRDPRIVFEAPADGNYLVRVFAFPATPDSSIRLAGGDAYLYRLTLTTGGFLDHAFPLAVSRDGPGPVEAAGPNIPEAARLLAVPTGDDGRDLLRLSHPLLAGTAEVRRVPGAAAIEAEPNDPGHPQAIPSVPALSGRIDPPGDVDAFLLPLKKGDARVIRVESRALGLPLDAALRLTDAGGKVLAEADDAGEGRDPELSFTAPADGAYRIAVRDLAGRGGPRFAYLLRVLAAEPDFALALPADRFTLVPGKATKVTVAIARKDGYAGVIEVAAEGLPRGVAAQPATSRPGDASAKAVTLEFLAEDAAPPGPVRIVGTEAEGPRRRRPARAAIEGFGATTDRPWLTIGAVGAK